MICLLTAGPRSGNVAPMLIAQAQLLAKAIADAGFVPADSPRAVALPQYMSPVEASQTDELKYPYFEPSKHQNTAIRMYGAYFDADVIAKLLGNADLQGRSRLWSHLYDSNPPSKYALYGSFVEWEGSTVWAREQRQQMGQQA